MADTDPFKNDRLDRKETAEVLTHLLGSIRGPCVLALDATWGMGKTTFLRMWKSKLENNGFSVVMFNAWDTDFADDPFLALSEELHAALKLHLGDDEDAATALRDAARKVLVTIGPTLIRTLLTSILGPGGGEIATGSLQALVDKSVSRYGEAKDAFASFRKSLEAAAGTLADKSDEPRPLVVIIDELDRCRPSYAVELLEVLKHLYSVDGVVFVLALNRDELVHSVQALYGAEFGAAVYLRRFIDIDVRLPDSDRKAFIDAQVDALQLDVQAVHGGAASERRVDGFATDWLHRFFGNPELDLRTLEQAFRRLGLVLAMLRGDRSALISTATFVLILRTMEPDLYKRFLDGRATDEEVADALFGRLDSTYRTTIEGQNFETEIIVAATEDDLIHGRSFEAMNSRLLAKYHELTSTTIPKARAEEREHARTIINFVSAEYKKRRHQWGDRKFRDTVARLEILSEELRHDSA
ncbi:MAG: P-loop NTPase fold protein [Rhodospirillales bacterium]|nr:P-loop NTPase fold protein [Rhodospirillales bacterium]